VIREQENRTPEDQKAERQRGREAEQVKREERENGKENSRNDGVSSTGRQTGGQRHRQRQRARSRAAAADRSWAAGWERSEGAKERRSEGAKERRSEGAKEASTPQRWDGGDGTWPILLGDLTLKLGDRAGFPRLPFGPIKGQMRGPQVKSATARRQPQTQLQPRQQPQDAVPDPDNRTTQLRTPTTARPTTARPQPHDQNRIITTPRQHHRLNRAAHLVASASLSGPNPPHGRHLRDAGLVERRRARRLVLCMWTVAGGRARGGVRVRWRRRSGGHSPAPGTG
jgi:hypothetical protein